jgi:hypothetical protein
MKIHAPAKTETTVRRQALPPVPASLAHQEHYREVLRKAGVQPKLDVGALDDPAEREADAVVERVLQDSEPLQAPMGETEHSSSLRRLTTAVTNADSSLTDTQAARVLSPGAGRPLPTAVRDTLEPRFGHDFSAVQLHDSTADRDDAKQLAARAFTFGHHIWLGHDQHADDLPLMAHELAHVVQQSSGTGTAIRRLTAAQSTAPAQPVKTSPSQIDALQAEAREDALKIKQILQGNIWPIPLNQSEIMGIIGKWAQKPMQTGSRLSAFDYLFVALRTQTYEVGVLVKQSTSVFDQLFERMSAERVTQFKAWMQTKGQAFKNEQAFDQVKFEVSKEDVIRGVKVGGELALAVGSGGTSMLARILLWVGTELPDIYKQAETIIDTVNAIRGTKLDDLKQFISAKSIGNILVKALFGEVQNLPSLASKEKDGQDAKKTTTKSQGEKGLMGLLHHVMNTIANLKQVGGKVFEFINKALSAMDISRQGWFKPFSMAYSVSIKAIQAIGSPGAVLNEAAGKLREVVSQFFNGIRTKVESVGGEIKSHIQVLGAPASFLISLADRALEWVLNLLISHPPSEGVKQAFAIIQAASGKSIVQLVRDNIPFADEIFKKIAESSTVQGLVEPLKPPVSGIIGAVDNVTKQAGTLISSTESRALGLLGDGAHLVKELAGATPGTPEAHTEARVPAASPGDFLAIVKQGLHSRIMAIGERNLMEKGRELGKAALEKGVTTGKALAAKVKGILLGNMVPFEVRGKQHNLWTEERNGEVVVLVASDEKTIERKINDFHQGLSFVSDKQLKKEAEKLIKDLDAKNVLLKGVAKSQPDQREHLEQEMVAIEKRLEEIITTTGLSTAVPSHYKIQVVSLDPKSPDYLKPDDWFAPQPPLALELPDGTRIWRDVPGGPPRHETLLVKGKGRQGDEKESWSRSEHGNLPAGPKYERAHTLGQGTGTESPVAIWYAPSYVNQTLQNKGIESFMRSLAANKSKDMIYKLLTKTAPHKPLTNKEPHRYSLRLSFIHYHVEMIIGGKSQGFFEYSINVSNNAEHPLITAGPISFSNAAARQAFQQQASIPDILLNQDKKQL